MSKYKVSEPSALKFLKANGAVVDENGNVVNEASDYWKKVYEQAEPKVCKYLHADGTIDENPGSGGGGTDLEDNKTVTITENGTIEILPTEGKDGMKKVTATVNVPSSGGSATVYVWQEVDSRTPMSSKYAYMSVDVAPADQTAALAMKNLSGNLESGTLAIASIPSIFTYTRISDTKFELSAEIGGNPFTLTYTRDTTKDLVIWG